MEVRLPDDMEGYELLGIAVIKQAVVDYSYIYADFILTGGKKTAEHLRLERFFNSALYEIYCPHIHADYILRRSKLLGVERAYQLYIQDLADMLQYGKTQKTDRMLAFEDYLNTDRYKTIAGGLICISPERILKNAEKYCYEHDFDRIKKGWRIRLSLDGKNEYEND